jgi:hypothetical protein
MNCTNKEHHVHNDQPCSNGDGVNPDHGHHKMHWHINKNSFKALILNLVYFSLHAVTIGILLSK